MKSSTSQKVKAGIFVAAGIAVLLLIIFFIGNQKNLFRSTIKLHVNYRNVAGLQEGSFVRFAGINVGVVDLIEIKNDTTVRVEISIQKKVKQFLKMMV
jgi:phospholipid/cholesterol/gamma-HCH transport system substrate-binding protein